MVPPSCCRVRLTTRNLASCVPLQVGVAVVPVRCPGQASPVRLCRYWLRGIRAIRGLRVFPKAKAIGFRPSACRPRSSSLMNTLAVMCIAETRDNAFFCTCRFRSPHGGDDCGPGAYSAQLQWVGGVTGSRMLLNESFTGEVFFALARPCP